MTADRLIAGRYRLTDPIGTGAMGVVWRATDVRLQRTVAVKQVLLAPNLTPAAALESKRRAMREGRIAARLHHPNAITVFDVAEEDGQPWLVMEYMDAPSLAAKLSGGQTLPPEQVAKIGAQAAAALAAAHEAGIVHRDVKPANLLVSDDDKVKITDFGISRAVGDVTVTATGFLAGTPAYLAPEVARGEDPEPASDVFALGSTLYAAVQGSPPFGEGDNPLAVLHAVAGGHVEPPRDAGLLGDVLMRLLAPAIADRPTMREAAEALEDVAAGRVPRLLPEPQTKALTAAEGADGATKVLPRSDSGSLGAAAHAETQRPSNDTASTALVSYPSPPGNSAPQGLSKGPLVLPRPGTTLPGGTGGTGGPGRRRMIGWVVEALTVVLVVGVLVALAVRGSHDEDTAAPSVPASQTSGDAGAPSGGAPAQRQSETPGAPDPFQSADTQAPSTAPGVPPAPGVAPSVGPPPPSSTVAPSSGAPSSTARPSTTAVTTTPAGPPSPDRIAAFIQGYYGMLPGNVSGAWAQLAPGYQAQTGYDSYVRFWGTIRAVSVGAVTPSGTERAVVALTYTLKNGTTTSEQRWIQVVGEGNRLLIAASGT